MQIHCLLFMWQYEGMKASGDQGLWQVSERRRWWRRRTNSVEGLWQMTVLLCLFLYFWVQELQRVASWSKHVNLRGSFFNHLISASQPVYVEYVASYHYVTKYVGKSWRILGPELFFVVVNHRNVIIPQYYWLINSQDPTFWGFDYVSQVSKLRGCTLNVCRTLVIVKK